MTVFISRITSLYLMPTSPHLGGRLFTIFYVLIGLVFIFAIINDFAQSIIRAAEAKALEKLDDDPTDDKVIIATGL